MPARILIVEEVQDLQALFRQVLAHAGHEVLTAPDADLALKTLRESDIDAVILDVNLPGTSGLEVLEAIEREGRGEQVVVVTSHASVDVAIKALRAGAVDLLEKPVGREALLGALDRALLRQRERAAKDLHVASQVVFATVEAQRLPEAIVRAARSVMAADDVSLLLPGADGQLYVAHSDGLPAEIAAQAQIALGATVAGRVAADRIPAVLTDLELDPRFRDLSRSGRVRSSIVYPLVSGDRLMGVLNLNRNSDARPFRRADLQRVSILAAEVLLALENVRLIRQAIASERLASIGQLAAGVGHEINNPVTYVLTNQAFVQEGLAKLAELGQRLAAGAGAEELHAWWRVNRGEALLGHLRAAAADANQGAERIREIVRDMRALANTDEVNGAPLDVNEPIRSALRLAGAELRGRGELITQLGEGVHVLGCAGPLSQVFINLLVNAAHAVGEVKRDRHEIRVTSRRNGPRVLVELSDTGTGISAAHLARLFEPFFTTKGATTGTGLGLWISREIVRRHGGELRVRSQQGQGTTFELDLPGLGLSLAEDAGPKDRSAAAPDGPTRRPRVLFVDDELGILRAYKRFFGPRYEVVVADGGTPALDLLAKSGRFDVVVCDLLMPDLTGMELYQRAVAFDPKLKDLFLFVTGSAGVSQVREFLGTLENGYLEKPFELSVLQERIQSRVSHS